MTNSLLQFTKKAMEFWRNRFDPIERNTRRTAEATERIDTARGRGSGIVIEGSSTGEPVPVTLTEDVGNTVSSEQLPATLGPGGGMQIEGVDRGVPVTVMGKVGLTDPVALAAGASVGVTSMPAITGVVALAGTPQISGTVAVSGKAKTYSDQLPDKLGGKGGLPIEGVDKGVPVTVQGRVSLPDAVQCGYGAGTLAFGSVASTFTLVLALTAPAKIITVLNATDQAVIYSADGGNAHGYVPAYSSWDVPLREANLVETRSLWIKHAGIAPLSGSVFVNAVT